MTGEFEAMKSSPFVEVKTLKVNFQIKQITFLHQACNKG